MFIKGKTLDSTKDSKNIISKEAFKIRPGEEITLDPKDGAESSGNIELDDEVEEFIVGENKKLNIGKALIGKTQNDLIQFLTRNIDIFTWSVSDMLGINRDITEHKLYINP
jgi:hypothetical protein